MIKQLVMKIIFCFVVLISVTGIASAKECYYINSNGVCLDEKEYNFLSFMFWDGSQELMTQDDYNKFVSSDIINGEIDSKTYIAPMTRGTEFSSNSKKVKITKSCTSNCLVSVNATWFSNPNIKSYDVIGAYLENTSLVNSPITTISSSVGSNTSKEIQKFNNGFGVSVKLHEGSNIVINQTFRVKKQGHIYASYQHATKNITLAGSKNYTIDYSGYGHVFKFNGTASSTYDMMNGVDIAL